MALAFEALSPGTRVFSAEPEGFDDHRRSLEAGRRIANEPGGVSSCDALMAPIPGVLTFGVNSRLLAGGVRAGEEEVFRAMAVAFEHFKLVVEPGGAAALAAALAGRLPIAGKTVVVVCSGGNADQELFRQALAPTPGGTS